MTIGPNLSQVDSTPYFRVGEEFVSALGACYKYCKTASAIAKNKLCFIDKDSLATSTNTTFVSTKPGNAGICQGEVTAADQYAWYAIGPFPEDEGIKVSALASCLSVIALYTSATTGSVDDTAGSNDKVQGLALAEANGGSTADVACYATQRLTFN